MNLPNKNTKTRKIIPHLLVIILLLIFGFVGGNYLMHNKNVPVLLQKKESVIQVNKEAQELWRVYMLDLANVKILKDKELNSYPSIKSLGDDIILYPVSNIPAHIQARSSRNRNVNVVFIFEPGTKPLWDNMSSAIKIDSNIFVLHSSGWKGE